MMKKLNGGTENVPLCECLFLMSYNLCKEFPAMSPFYLDEKPFCEVVGLYARLRTVQIKEEKEVKKHKQTPEVIRRPAGDNWF